MPALASPPRGRFIWHELMTTDPDAAVGFYSKVVGWGTEQFPNMPDYRVWTMKNSPPMGGLMRLPDEARQMGAPPHWVPYVAVPNVDQTVLQATGLGARTYVPGMDVPDVGRIAVLADPQGATFAIYTPAIDDPGSDDAELGDFSWHELATTDWKAAWEFYQKLFGWKHTSTMDMGPAGPYFMFTRAGGTKPLGGIYNMPADMPAANWMSYARVADADKAAAAAVAAGGRLVREPMEVPGGDRIAMLVDPQGALFAVHTLAAAAKAPAKKKAAKKKATKTVAKKKSAPKKVAAKKKAAPSKGAKRKAAAKKAVKRAGAAVKKAMGRARAAVKKVAGRIKKRK